MDQEYNLWALVLGKPSNSELVIICGIFDFKLFFELHGNYFEAEQEISHGL